MNKALASHQQGPGIFPEIEQVMLNLPQLDCPIQHHFAPGVYIREMFAPKGALVLGHAHKTEHLNILVCGRIRLLMGDKVAEMQAPCTFVSKPGARKLFYMLEDVVFSTVHATIETDVDRLEDQLIEKSDVWKQAQLEAATKKLLTEEK